MRIAIVFVTVLGLSQVARGDYTYWVPFRCEIPGPDGTYNGVLGISLSADNLVQWDYEDDGTPDGEIVLGAGEHFHDVKFSVGTRFVSQGMLELYQGYAYSNSGIYEDGYLRFEQLPEEACGADYWVPTEASMLSILSFRDGTEVLVDRDHDGMAEESHGLCRGLSTQLSVGAGTHLWGPVPFLATAVHFPPGQPQGRTYSYALLPRRLLGTSYHAPHEHPYGLVDPTNETGVHLVATEDATTVTVDGKARTLDAGQVLFHPTTDEAHIQSDKPVFAVYRSEVSAQDPSVGPAPIYRRYSYAFPLLAESGSPTFVILPNCGRRDNRTETVDPLWEAAIVSFGDHNTVTLDFGGDGKVEHTQVLNAGEFLYMQDQDEHFGFWADQKVWVRSSAPIQPSLTYRYSWASTSEKTFGLTFFGDMDIHPESGDVLFQRGNVTADGETDIADAVAMLGYLFLGSAAPPCLDAADSDDNGGLSLTDPVYLLNQLFLGGPTVAAPSPGCGVDPTEDLLGCEGFAPCEPR